MDSLGVVAELGRRLRLARERAGFTQAQAADEIDVGRATLVAIESGERRVRMEELRRLARSYGESVNALTRPEAVYVDLLPGFNRAWDWFEANGGITNQQAKQVLNDLVADDVDRTGTSQPGTLRLNLLAAEAYRQGLMSEGQLARLLRLDRIALREILDSVDAERDFDGLPQLSR